MVNPGTALNRFRTVIYAIAIPLVVTCVALIAVQPGLSWVVIPALVGGVATAGILVIVNRRHHADAGPDGAPIGRIGMMNIAHVQVAGFGGLGLVITSAFVALQYQFTTAALVIAAVGAVLVAIGLVRYRRRHPTEVLHV